MLEYVEALIETFTENADARIRPGKEAYMRNQFPFLGIPTPHLRKLWQPFVRQDLLPKGDVLHHVVKTFWQMPEREYQYFAQELALKACKKMAKDDLALFAYMVTHKSWWDTVDFIATRLIGGYFRAFPEEVPAIIPGWLDSGHLWLQRSAILFQLKYKAETDTALLSRIIEHMLGSNEFFINKAIGWALREYSKTDPGWVLHFAETHDLHPLSRREALRLID